MSIEKVLNNYKFCIGDEVTYVDRSQNTIFVIDNMQLWRRITKGL